jgi:hypothetical protein
VLKKDGGDGKVVGKKWHYCGHTVVWIEDFGRRRI